MASARQKEIKIEHLRKQVERLDGRIAKAKVVVIQAQDAVTVLEAQKTRLAERLKWQQDEPVSEDDGDELVSE